MAKPQSDTGKGKGRVDEGSKWISGWMEIANFGGVNSIFLSDSDFRPLGFCLKIGGLMADADAQ